jgi:hypothetical protein
MPAGFWHDAEIVRHDLVLRWKRFTMMRDVPNSVRDMDIDVAWNYMIEGLIVRATGHVLGEQLPSHTETAVGYAHFEAPATWWQHVKYQHGHRWWLKPLAKRRPARMTAKTKQVTLTATWENMAAYPWADVATIAPQRWVGDPVRLTWMTSSMDWDAT